VAAISRMWPVLKAHGDSDTHADSDVQRRPHWRRGHWKMQAHGPGLTQHKRLFIKPVIVNRHLLVGDLGALQTSYRIR
jgi:hypothetical protein